MDAEPQKNGKTINWCTVDVGDANGTGEPQGIVCGAHNFAPGDLVVVVLPGGVLPGGFEISARKTYGHVSAGMICSARELGLGEDHDGIIVLPADAGEPGDDALDVLGLDDEVIEFEINPDRAYALSLRGVAREAALAYGAPFRDPADREVPGAERRRLPGRDRRPAGLPGVRGPHWSPASTRPRRRPTGWRAGSTWPGMRPISLAVDVTNYVMLELGQPIHGYDADKLAGPIRVRRATEGERLTTLDGVDADPVGRGPRRHRRLRPDRPRRRHGRRDHRDVRRPPPASWSRPRTGTPVSMFRTGKRHRLTSEAGKRNERGVDPLLPARAADRVVELLTTYGGGTVDPGVTVVGTPPPPPTIPIDSTCPPGSPAWRSTRRPPSRTSRRSAARSTKDDTGVDRDARRRGAPTSPTPTTWSRRSPGSSATTEVPSVLPTAPGRARPDPRAAAAPSGRPHPGRRRLRRGDQLPVRRRRRPSTRSACPPTTRAGTRSGSPTRCRRGAGVHHDAAARPAQGGRPQHRSRRARASRCSRPAPSRFPADRGPAPISASTGGRPTASSPSWSRRSPTSRCTSAVVLAGERERAGWWGEGREAGWADAIGAGPAARPPSSASRSSVAPAARMPWHPGRCAEAARRRAGARARRRAAPEGLPGVRRAAAHRGGRDRPRRAAAARRDVVPAPEFSTFPVAKEDVALVVDESVPVADVEAALREGAGELLESIRLFDVYTGDQIGRGQEVAGVRAALPGPRPHPDRGGDRAARDAAVALAAERTGAVQRLPGDLGASATRSCAVTQSRSRSPHAIASAQRLRQSIGWWTASRKWSYDAARRR